ncbi:GNAT family N-acetyltransferase [Propionibacteriaceae bacterium Y1685]|uniref:GNAT family N-acetyltransferase n=1 Tax=Microlunatus sp. Y1700 TaxID=3418487 RepID=UPI003B823C9B
MTVTTGVRDLTNDDLRAAIVLLLQRPVENLFVSSRLRLAGLEPFTLGCSVWGYESEGELRAMLHAGSNFVPVNADHEALVAFADRAGARRCSSITGESEMVMDLWRLLCERHASWQNPREVRARQLVMVIDHDPIIEPELKVQRITEDVIEPYFDAAVKMYTEEVGVSPVEGSPAAYRSYVSQLIKKGRAFGIVDNGETIFKADLGCVSGQLCQVQGVWLHPRLRGRGLAPAMMAQVVALARQEHPLVSLYVNDFNERAVATYRRVGFRDHGTFATILY